MSESPRLNIDRVNLRIILDDMCVPHIASELYTKNMSGVDASMLNMKLYCKRNSGIPEVIGILKEYLQLMNVAAGQIKLDIKSTTVNENLEKYAQEAMSDICKTEKTQIVSPLLPQESVQEEPAGVWNNEIAGSSDAQPQPQPQPTSLFPNASTQARFTIDKRAEQSISMQTDTARGIARVSPELMRCAILLAEHIKRNPVGVPDMSLRTMKGCRSINNYINAALGKIFTQEDALVIARETLNVIRRN